MPLKIRLTRQGRKKRPFYHIVLADSRAPRDGKYIERIGIYNPVSNPATIEINFNRALYWVQQGAQPTDTCRTLLAANGVMYKKHLLEGVKKGAFSEEEAETRFDAWKKEKEAKLQANKSKINMAKDEEAKKRFEAEAKVNEAKAKEIAKKNARLAEVEAKAAKEDAEEVVEEIAEEKVSGETITEETAVEESTSEETVSEAAVAEETVAEETVIEAKEEDEVSSASDHVSEENEESQKSTEGN